MILFTFLADLLALKAVGASERRSCGARRPTGSGEELSYDFVFLFFNLLP